MINSNFSFSKGILQERLKNAINKKRFDNNENQWRIATFAPEKYSGVNIRFLTKRLVQSLLNNTDTLSSKDGQVSIFVFKSGKSTITGAKKVEDLLEAYKAITDFVRNRDELFMKSI
jgi:hypothetical protein